MIKAKHFRDLLVWQKAHNYTLLVYKETKKFPKEELYGLSNQVRRAAISIGSNIAEGYSRKNPREKRQFLYIARMVLPLNTYTEWYWKIDLKNLLHFLNLRCDENSQQEIRVYADAILKLITPIVPWTIEAWEDYSPYRGGMTLTRQEVDVLKDIFRDIPNLYNAPLGEEADLFKDIEVNNNLERKEWIDKASRLGVIWENERLGVIWTDEDDDDDEDDDEEED